MLPACLPDVCVHAECITTSLNLYVHIVHIHAVSTYPVRVCKQQNNSTKMDGI